MGAVTSRANFSIKFAVTQTAMDILYYCFCHARVGCLQTTKLSVFKIVIKRFIIIIIIVIIIIIIFIHTVILHFHDGHILTCMTV
jgi:hypothetical protein